MPRNVEDLSTDMDQLRQAVDRLANNYRWARAVAAILLVLILVVTGLGIWGRSQIAHEACVADQKAIEGGREANEIFLEALVLAITPDTPEEEEQVQAFVDDVHRRQDEALPIREC